VACWVQLQLTLRHAASRFLGPGVRGSPASSKPWRRRVISCSRWLETVMYLERGARGQLG
jgi:hypothetical protein